ncbi:MAG: nitrogen regulation protein NR(II) [Planctomycetota bacterium]
MRLLCVSPPEGGRPFDDLLGELAHEPTWVPDLARALRTARRLPLDAALVPLEPTTLERLRERYPHLPLIAYGAADSALAAAQAHGWGALGYLPIPRPEHDGAITQVLADLLGRAAARSRVEEARRAELEENLRLRKFYSDVLTSVGQGIVVIDHRGKIRYRNPASERFLGETDGLTALDGQAAVPVLQQLVETLTEGQTRNQTIALEEDQRKLFLDLTTSVLRAADGKPSGAVAIVSDRSIEKSLEQQLVHTERLATLGSLLASIAHEINNTLTSITGCAEMGLMIAEQAEQHASSAGQVGDAAAQEAWGSLSVEIRQIFDLVLEAGISCQTIADNMLQYSRQGKPSHRSPQDLNLLIERTIKVLGKHLGVEKVTLQLELDPRGPRARIEASKLQQTLVNLIVNAVQAMLDRDVPFSERVLRVETVRDDEHGLAVIRVNDTGPGIPARRLEQIFQPFFTTKDHGTGLGLYISRRVIEEQEGTITVESEVGVGTTFSITLPLK